MATSDDDLNDKKMPLLDHLIELRTRLIWSIAALLVCFLVAYYFSGTIFDFLVRPLQQIQSAGSPRRMIFTAPTEAFFTYVKVAFFTALFVSFPVIATQIWMFVAPGLYKHEKQAFLPFLAATPVLFLVGAAFLYYVILPLALRFFASFEVPAGEGQMPIELEAKMSEYLSLVMALILAFGISFQLPVLLTLLAKVGIVSSDGAGGQAPLRDRRHPRRRRRGDAARRVQQAQPRLPDVPPLRGLDLDRPADREEARGGRCAGRGGARRRAAATRGGTGGGRRGADGRRNRLQSDPLTGRQAPVDSRLRSPV